MDKATVLIVDDDPIILAMMSKILEGQYRLRAANSGERALEIAFSDSPPSLILLDVLMPMDGYTVLAALKDNPSSRDIPVIFVTSMDGDDDEEKGFKLGVVDYLTKPIKPAILLARVHTQLALKQAKIFLQDKNIYLEAEIKRRMKENQLMQRATIHALASLADLRHPETGKHIIRTQAYVHILATLLQQDPRFKQPITDDFIDAVAKSAPLHDIGKVGIPDSILLKAGNLTEDERKIMNTHAEIGARAIQKAEEEVGCSIKFLRLAKEISHWHHERWDGSGYPDGLVGKDIPVSARLMALADVFDALISARVYKSAMSMVGARDIIEKSRGNHFDPVMTDIFLDNFEKFVEVASEHSDADNDSL